MGENQGFLSLQQTLPALRRGGCVCVESLRVAGIKYKHSQYSFTAFRSLSYMLPYLFQTVVLEDR